MKRRRRVGLIIGVLAGLSAATFASDGAVQQSLEKLYARQLADINSKKFTAAAQIYTPGFVIEIDGQKETFRTTREMAEEIKAVYEVFGPLRKWKMNVRSVSTKGKQAIIVYDDSYERDVLGTVTTYHRNVKDEWLKTAKGWRLCRSIVRVLKMEEARRDPRAANIQLRRSVAWQVQEQVPQAA